MSPWRNQLTQLVKMQLNRFASALNDAHEPVLLEVLHASDFLTQVLNASLQPDKLAA